MLEDVKDLGEINNNNYCVLRLYSGAHIFVIVSKLLLQIKATFSTGLSLPYIKKSGFWLYVLQIATVHLLLEYPRAVNLGDYLCGGRLHFL